MPLSSLAPVNRSVPGQMPRGGKLAAREPSDDRSCDPCGGIRYYHIACWIPPPPPSFELDDHSQIRAEEASQAIICDLGLSDIVLRSNAGPGSSPQIAIGQPVDQKCM